MKTHIPQQIIVPVYYHIDEDGIIQFDTEQMEDFFREQMTLLESNNFNNQ
jgi:hypothetical protein